MCIDLDSRRYSNPPGAWRSLAHAVPRSLRPRELAELIAPARRARGARRGAPRAGHHSDTVLANVI